MSATIDVVIPVYGRFELTDACLRSLAAQTAAHRVIVVDDGSPDDSADRIACEWPNVTLLRLQTNRGYTHAINRGVRAGDGDYVVLMNNDVTLEPDFLQRLIEPLNANQRIGSVAALLLRPGGQAIDSFGVTADATLAGFPRLQGERPQRALAPTMTLTGPEGTAGVYRRSAWEEVGGLDETIVAYMEILDLALRLAAAGWLAGEAPRAVGVHLGSSTYGRRSQRQRRLAGFSRGYLLRRYGVIGGRHGPRAALTELLAVTVDALVSRDLQALTGRVEGWRAARGASRHSPPPSSVIDPAITFWRSMKLRRNGLGD